ncbi:unnamed protein product [Spirodela intermedia]|uniref:Uncharacterized protein n=1 Tax=Spirodela intermedia TaxID=51605 RepID=A0A7I8JLY3_SPIIN|nr:unnamed protein product [Spirodela intermedia]CAA6670801.1 unnamed protein product [Spirodela intermedia]
MGIAKAMRRFLGQFFKLPRPAQSDNLVRLIQGRHMAWNPKPTSLLYNDRVNDVFRSTRLEPRNRHMTEEQKAKPKPAAGLGLQDNVRARERENPCRRGRAAGNGGTGLQLWTMMQNPAERLAVDKTRPLAFSVVPKPAFNNNKVKTNIFYTKLFLKSNNIFYPVSSYKSNN